jgi:hypothetical protein
MNEIVLMNKITNAEMGDMNCVSQVVRERNSILTKWSLHCFRRHPMSSSLVQKALDHVVLLASVFALPSL